jgi:hypothetical protein
VEKGREGGENSGIRTGGSPEQCRKDGREERSGGWREQRRKNGREVRAVEKGQV